MKDRRHAGVLGPQRPRAAQRDPHGSYGDPTPPTIEASAVGRSGLDGLYVGDITVSWTVRDEQSPIVTREGCKPRGRHRRHDRPRVRLHRDQRRNQHPHRHCPPRRHCADPHLPRPDLQPRCHHRHADRHRQRRQHEHGYLYLPRHGPATNDHATADALVCHPRADRQGALPRPRPQSQDPRASIRLGTAKPRRLELNRRRTAVVLPKTLKRGRVHIATTYRKARRIRTLRRTFTAC